MKRLYILLTLLVAAATNLAAQTGYLPLVREGVRWICFDFASNYEDGDEFQIYSYEFIGDSILYQNKFGTRFRYKRLYQKNLYSIHRNTNQQLSIEDVAQSKPKLVSLMRESGKKIYLPGFSTSDESEWTFENFATGFVLYDFSGTDAAIVGEYGMGEGHTYYNSFVFSNVVKIDGVDCRKYIYSTDNGVFAVIEGVGYAGSYGDLLRPNPDGGLPTCPCDFGLACLEDSDGKVLYKGSGYGLYMNFLRTICDFTGDGKVDVSDLSAAIDAAVVRAENGKADVNGDGRVDIADVNTVVNVILNAR